MDKKRALLELKQDLESRKDIPLIKTADDVVFGDGNPDAKIMFIGEAAGYHESVQHRPFVGQAGILLTKTLQETLGLKREEVYISNVVKTRPPDNRDPLPEEIEAFRPYLDKEIEIIQPRIIVTLGRFSMAKFIPGVTISTVHGQPRFVDFQGVRYIVFPMYHPAAALRGTTLLNAFKADFVKLKNFLQPASDVPVASTPQKEDNGGQLSLI